MIETQEPATALTSGATPDPTKPATVRLVIRARILPGTPVQAVPRRGIERRVIALALGVASLVIVVWIGMSRFGHDSNSTPAPRPPSPAATLPAEARVSTPTLEINPPASQAKPEPDSKVTTSIHEAMPAASRGALQTIRGTIKVSIRVVVNQDGTVQAATTRISGPSRYFERLALEAAKKWTFTPAHTTERRTMLIGFDFTRAGVTARAEGDERASS